MKKKIPENRDAVAETARLTSSELLCLVEKEKSGPEEALGATSPIPFANWQIRSVTRSLFSFYWLCCIFGE